MCPDNDTLADIKLGRKTRIAILTKLLEVMSDLDKIFQTNKPYKIPEKPILQRSAVTTFMYIDSNITMMINNDNINKIMYVIPNVFTNECERR